ncbi:MAG: histidine phosphatase family protein [Anaerolineae bacterium]|nr:histidine phosphatase family protein [Anaerolineae bacterium]MBT7072343.1 histidine phosphatase family protein [Anaerolineae bacterium]
MEYPAPLSDVGKEQAEHLARRLADEKFNAIYASDLKRAWETAAAIAEKENLAIVSEPRLREMDFGVLESLTWDEVQRKYPEMLERWLEDYNQPVEGGETLDAFSMHVLSFRDSGNRKMYGLLSITYSCCVQ